MERFSVIKRKQFHIIKSDSTILEKYITLKVDFEGYRLLFLQLQ